MKINKTIIVPVISGVALIFSVYATYVAVNNSNRLDDIEDTLEYIQNNLSNKTNMNPSEIKNIQANLNRLNQQIDLLNQKIIFLSKKQQEKINIQRDNLFFSKEIEKILKQLKINSKFTNNTQSNNQNNYMNLSSNKKEKKHKKIIKKKPTKFHLMPPSIIYISKITNQDNNIYLYTTDNTIIASGSYFENDFKVIKIDLKNKFIILKNINSKTYEYGRIYKVPFILKIGQINDLEMQNNNQQNTQNGPINIQNNAQ